MDIEKVVQNIQRICREKGTTPTVAARESGAGQGMVSALKRQGIIPSVEKMSMLASYLGVTVSELLGEHTPGAATGPEHLSPEALQMLKAYGRADSGTRAAVRKLLDLKNDDT